MRLADFTDFEIEGIDFNDYPDFADAFIRAASYRDSKLGWRDATEDELNWLNEQHDFVYELTLKEIY